MTMLQNSMHMGNKMMIRMKKYDDQIIDLDFLLYL